MVKGANNYYNKVAEIYDLMYTKETGYDHKAQVKWVDDFRKKLGLPKDILDVACGTGIHLMYFKKLGYKVKGIDASQEMLKIAKKRLKNVPLKKDFFENFILEKEVPIITSYFNAISYNTNVKKLKSTFKSIYKNLSKDGIFVFDLFCNEKPKEVFMVKKFESGKFKMSRTFIGKPTSKGFKSTMYYVISNGKSSKIISETSFRGAFSEKQIMHALKSTGFKVIYNGGGYAPEYNVFVAQK
ncbi:MAG: class I SAM-dependent DNA methyltransferase [Candidatus Woesearchaeota archaeon]